MSRLNVGFIDFKTAFDSVNRDKLRQVLNESNIQGHLFNVLKSMYERVKACVDEMMETRIILIVILV
jgi:hypothetical protein